MYHFSSENAGAAASPSHPESNSEENGARCRVPRPGVRGPQQPRTAPFSCPAPPCHFSSRRGQPPSRVHRPPEAKPPPPRPRPAPVWPSSDRASPGACLAQTSDVQARLPVGITRGVKKISEKQKQNTETLAGLMARVHRNGPFPRRPSYCTKSVLATRPKQKGDETKRPGAGLSPAGQTDPPRARDQTHAFVSSPGVQRAAGLTTA